MYSSMPPYKKFLNVELTQLPYCLAALYANFYASSHSAPPAQTADVLLPISNMRNDTGNDVSVPPTFSVGLFFFKHL